MPSILLVDDDMNLLRGLRRTLHHQPYSLFIANSADMAMEMFYRNSFDLVVVDQQMNGTSGADFIAWIAQHFPDTIRIMLTGHANVETMAQVVNNGGVFRFLIKPCHEMELALAIREGLESQLNSTQLRV